MPETTVATASNKFARGARKALSNPVVARFIVPVMVGTAVAITTHALTNAVEVKLDLNQNPAEPTPES